MGWSKGGLAKMATIRTYVENGGVVTATKVDAGEKIYQEYAQEQTARIFDGKYDWSIFEKECSPKGKVTGTSILLKAYGQAKAVI